MIFNNVKIFKCLSSSIALYWLMVFFSTNAFAFTEKENACYKDVQGTVAWSRGGSTKWDEKNVRNLCNNVNQPAKRISCFEAGIAAHNSWSKAIKDCQNAGTIVSVKQIKGKQCVYNKGGYILDVDWYNPAMIVFNGGNTDDYSNYTAQGKPHKTDRITLGYSSCTDVANRVAIVRVVGHDVANAAITITTGTAVGITTGVVGAFACVGTAGAGCPAAAAGVGAATAGAISAVALALPNTKEIAYIGSPGTKNYVDLYGTVWKPTISNLIPLSQKRKPIKEGFKSAAKDVGNWITDGKPSSKSITFNNQSGYVASMLVIYTENKNISGQKILTPVVKNTGNLSLGFSRHINLPANLPTNIPIQIFISGVGTIKKNIFSTTIPSNFTGNYCYKSWGTIFDAKGGKCK